MALAQSTFGGAEVGADPAIDDPAIDNPSAAVGTGDPVVLVNNPITWTAYGRDDRGPPNGLAWPGLMWLGWVDRQDGNDMRDKDRIRTVTMIAMAWERAGVGVACELCGGRDWALAAGPTTDGAALVLRQGDMVDHDACFLVYAVHCKNCGSLRTMAKSRIEELAGVDHK